MKATRTKADILADEAVADDLERIATSTAAPEIVACARRHLGNAEVLNAAHRALAEIWPGFFSCSNALRRALVEVDTARRLQTAALRLVPVELHELEDGNAYLAATFGVSGVVGTVIQGTASPDKAAAYASLFRIEVVKS